MAPRPHEHVLSLTPGAMILEDPGGKLNIFQAAGPELAGRYQQATGSAINRGVSQSAWWIRLRLAPPKKTGVWQGGWVLDTGSPSGLTATLYVQNGPDRYRRVAARGPHVPGKHPPNRHLYFFLPLIKGPTTLYLRVTSQTGILLPLSLRTRQNLAASLRQMRLWSGLYLGVAASLAFYNLFLFFFLGDKSYLWYSLYVLAMGGFFTLTNQSFADYGLLAGHRMVLALVGLGVVCTLQFTRAFLLTRQYAPGCDKALLVLMALYAAYIAATPLAPVPLLSRLASTLGTAMPLVILGTAVVRTAGGFAPARYFLAAWLVFLVGAVIYSLTYAGVLPYHTVTFYSFQVGSGLENILLSLALAVRIRSLRREKEALDQERDQLRGIFDSIQSGVILVDPASGLISEANLGAAHLTGRERGRILGRRLEEFFSRPVVEAELASSGPGVEGRLRRHGAEELPVLVNCSMVELAGQRRLLYNLVDIEARERAEADRAARDKLAAAIETAGAVCHELNQPLQVITGRLALMRLRRPDDEELAREVANLQEEVDRITSLSRSLGRITRYEVTPYTGRDQILDLGKATVKP